MVRIDFKLLAAFALATTMMSVPASAQEQEVKGIVVTNQGGVLTVKTPGGDQTIQLGGGIRVRSVSGVFGASKTEVPASSLLPGLPVTIDMEGGVATEIDYKAGDYKTAAQIEAGVQETTRRSEAKQRRSEANHARSVETARREAELRGAYSKMGEWEVRAETTVYFKTGSAALSPEGKSELTAIATKAKAVRGYAISVLGYADPTGNAAANERLSDRRAQAVINYLKQSGHVLPGRVLAASAMGEIAAAAEKPSDYASSRRVTVRVVTSAAHLNPGN